MYSLVTGGAGFIGSHLVEALVDKALRVRVFDNFSTGKNENLAVAADGVELVFGDLHNEAAGRAAVVGCEVVFHQAALASVPRGVEDPLATHPASRTLKSAPREAIWCCFPLLNQ